MSISVAPAGHCDAAELAEVAAVTFPLACPPSSSPDNVASFISSNLSIHRFTDYLDAVDRTVFAARDAHRILGYAIVIHGIGDDPDVSTAVTPRPAMELSKLYVLPDCHGSGVAKALMDASIAAAHEAGATCVWLGVNQKNERAQRFYRKCGFAVVGTKSFTVGAHIENDFVMMRPLTP